MILFNKANQAVEIANIGIDGFLSSLNKDYLAFFIQLCKAYHISL